MSYPLAVPRDVENVLTTVTSEQLGQLRNKAIADLHAGQLELDAAIAVCGVIEYELQLRQVEPLWRKAARFAKRNKEELSIAAAVLGLAVGVNIVSR